MDKMEIMMIPDLLAKSYALFAHKVLRDGAWPELFKTHLEKHYTGTDLNSKRTNFGRALTLQKTDSFSWETYYEGLAILAPMFDSLHIIIRLDKGTGVESYIYPVESDKEQWRRKKGVPIKPPMRDPDALFIPEDQSREDETPFTTIIRDAMIRQQLTVDNINKRLDEFIKDANNTGTFRVDTPANIKGSIKTTLCRGCIAWGNVPRLLKILGYRNLTIEVVSVIGAARIAAVAGVDL